DGQNARNEDGCAQIDDQYNDHNDADQNLMRQRTFTRSDGFLNQPRAIVEGNHGDFRDGTVRQGLLRKPRFHFPDRGLDLVDALHGICSVTGNHHASYRLHAFLIEAAAPGGGANGYKGDVFDLYRDLIAHGNHGILQVLNTLEVAQSAHQVFGLVDFNGFRADIEVAVLDRIHDSHDRYPVGTHGLGIHIDLIFLYKAADGRDLGNAFGCGKAVPDVKILNGPKLRGIPAARGFPGFRVPPFQGIPEDLAQRRCIRPEGGRHTGGQGAGRQGVQLFQNARTTPIKFDVFLKNDVKE